MRDCVLYLPFASSLAFSNGQRGARAHSLLRECSFQYHFCSLPFLCSVHQFISVSVTPAGSFASSIFHSKFVALFRKTINTNFYDDQHTHAHTSTQESFPGSQFHCFPLSSVHTLLCNNYYCQHQKSSTICSNEHSFKRGENATMTMRVSFYMRQRKRSTHIRPFVHFVTAF